MLEAQRCFLHTNSVLVFRVDGKILKKTGQPFFLSFSTTELNCNKFSRQSPNSFLTHLPKLNRPRNCSLDMRVTSVFGNPRAMVTLDLIGALGETTLTT